MLDIPWGFVLGSGLVDRTTAHDSVFLQSTIISADDTRRSPVVMHIYIAGPNYSDGRYQQNIDADTLELL